MNLYEWLIVATFFGGYLLIIFEHNLRTDKATAALMMAVLCWGFQFMDPANTLEYNSHLLSEHLSEISQIVFFLLAALTIVETINAHGGFSLLTRFLRFRSKKKILWISSFVTFFLSAIIGGLTVTIVMLSVLNKLVRSRRDQLIIGSAIVIAANAGGAWAPIGDITTTMLWVGGQVSALEVMRSLILPSLSCLITSIFVLNLMLKGEVEDQAPIAGHAKAPKGRFVCITAITALVMVPIFRYITGLPPFMGMLTALTVIWIITDLFHRSNENRSHLLVNTHISRIDLPGIIFFLGILLAVDALDASKLLFSFAQSLEDWLPSHSWLAASIGISSALVDNVPLVAATQKMFLISDFPMNHSLWKMIAYTAGTGGSILIIGSAPGVAFMSLFHVSFFWYFKHVALPAFIGFFAGFGVYLLQEGIFTVF